MRGDGVEGSTRDIAVAASAFSSSLLHMGIVGASVSFRLWWDGGIFGRGTRYRMGSEGAVFEVGRVAADTFDLKVAESPFSSPRMPLMSRQR